MDGKQTKRTRDNSNTFNEHRGHTYNHCAWQVWSGDKMKITPIQEILFTFLLIAVAVASSQYIDHETEAEILRIEKSVIK